MQVFMVSTNEVLDRPTLKRILDRYGWGVL